MAEMVWPTRCCGCNALGELFCERCRAALPLIDAAAACPECGAPFGRLVCCACAEAHPEAGLSAAERRAFSMGLLEPARFPFAGARCACNFTGAARALVTTFKDADEVRLAPVIAGVWVEALAEWLDWCDVLVPIPTTAEARRRRGFDHLRLVCEEMARVSGVPLACVLRSSKTFDQRHLRAQERAANLVGSFTLAAGGPVRGKKVLLVDDVMTTGSTLAAATRCLLAAGAAEVRVSAFARVW